MRHWTIGLPRRRSLDCGHCSLGRGPQSRLAHYLRPMGQPGSVSFDWRPGWITDLEGPGSSGHGAYTCVCPFIRHQFFACLYHFLSAIFDVFVSSIDLYITFQLSDGANFTRQLYYVGSSWIPHKDMYSGPEQEKAPRIRPRSTPTRPSQTQQLSPLDRPKGRRSVCVYF
jgi:hypothetical protein